MRCLVLGGAGFIGSHVVARLVAAGHAVRVVDLHPNPYTPPPPGVECLWSDWNDPACLEQALTGIDVVVHLIGTLWPGKEVPGACGQVNDELQPTLRLLEGCVAKGVRRIVFLSSGGTVYGLPHHTPIDESHALRPICTYGVAKLTIEHVIHLYHHKYGLEYVILRGANIYGEHHSLNRPQGAVNVFLKKLALGEEIEIWGDGTVVRDFLYVGDMARAVRLAVEAPIPAEVLNVGSGKGVSVNELLAIVGDATGSSPTVRYLAGRGCDVPANILAIDRIRAVTGWLPEVGLRDGVARTWRWTSNATGGQGRGENDCDQKTAQTELSPRPF